MSTPNDHPVTDSDYIRLIWTHIERMEAEIQDVRRLLGGGEQQALNYRSSEEEYNCLKNSPEFKSETIDRRIERNNLGDYTGNLTEEAFEEFMKNPSVVIKAMANKAAIKQGRDLPYPSKNQPSPYS